MNRLELVPGEAGDLAKLGVRIADAATEQLGFVHPENPDWSHISFCLFASPIARTPDGPGTRHAVAIRPGKIDRSPTGTGVSARLAVLHATEFDLARTEAHLQTMETCGGDAAVFAETDERFHLALARCAHNALILWMMEKMHEVRSHAQWARMRTITLEPGIIAAYNRQHRGIVDAIRARDAEAAGRLMREHLDTARQSLIEAAT